MSFLKNVGKVLLGPLGMGLGGLLFGKPKTPRLPGPVTRDDASEEAARETELQRRRGAGADRMGGAPVRGSTIGGLGRFIPGS